MKNIMITLCFLCITLGSYAQCEDLLIGKWKFKDIIKTEKLGKQEIDEINKIKKSKLVTSMFLNFKKEIDGKYGKIEGVILNETLKGAVWIKIDCNMFEIVNDFGKYNNPNSWDLWIIKATKDELIFNIGTNDNPPHLLFVKVKD